MSKLFCFLKNYGTVILGFLVGLLIVCIVIVGICIASQCTHDLVGCADSDSCGVDWHLHEARCKKCGDFIGYFTTEEMVKWNGVDKK